MVSFLLRDNIRLPASSHNALYFETAGVRPVRPQFKQAPTLYKLREGWVARTFHRREMRPSTNYPGF
jgi:hypothetical protein